MIKNIMIVVACLVYAGLLFAQPESHVTVYEQPGCQYCQHLEQELSTRDVDYTTVNDTANMFPTHPVTIICNHRVCMRVVGDNIGQIMKDLK